MSREIVRRLSRHVFRVRDGFTRQRGVLVTLVAAVLMAGCSGAGSEPVADERGREEQWAEALARPDFDQVSARYLEMQAKIRERLAADFGFTEWTEDVIEGGGFGCREYPDIAYLEKRSAGLPFWILHRAIPDETWPKVVAAIDEVARGYGFESPPRTIADQPGNHEVTVADGFGADLIFGVRVAAVMRVRTGCHLTPEAHRRGMPPATTTR